MRQDALKHHNDQLHRHGKGIARKHQLIQGNGVVGAIVEQHTVAHSASHSAVKPSKPGGTVRNAIQHKQEKDNEPDNLKKNACGQAGFIQHFEQHHGREQVKNQFGKGADIEPELAFHYRAKTDHDAQGNNIMR
ncbi:hypothetical protein D3C75_834350 [compost metagenome]